MNNAIVEFEEISYRYDDGRWANVNINLTIYRGELFCLLGPNGAGKSTLIKQLTAVLRPTKGRVLMDGSDLHKNAMAARCRMGIIPQDVGLFDQLTVEQHLAYFYQLKGLSQYPTRDELELLMQKTALTNLRTRKITGLSTGERRRILLALALIGDPKLLVLDEPTVALDPEVRRMLWSLIRAEKRAGKTIILTTHYLDEAERLADRIGIIEHGRLSCVGTISELFQRTARTLKVTEIDPESGEGTMHHYFDTLADAQKFIQSNQITEYYIGRVGLEDIYHKLMEKNR